MKEVVMLKSRSLFGIFAGFILLFAFAGHLNAQVTPPEETAKEETEKPSEQFIMFDFRDAEIKTVIEFMARLSDLIVIMDEKIKGKITIFSPKRLTIDEAYKVLMAVLDVRGLTMTKTDRFLRVIEKKEAVQSPLDIYYGVEPESVPDEDRVITHIIPLQNTDANEIQSNIRPLISREGNVFVNKQTNSIVITDIATNIRRLLSLISRLDVRRVVPSREETVVYPVKYVKAKDMGDALQKVFGKGVGDKTDIQITPVEAVNAVIVTADPGIHKQVNETLKELDVRRRQVLLEAKIVEVTLSEGLDFGVNLAKYLFSGEGLKHTVTMAGQIATPFVSYSVTSDKVDAALQMLSKKDKINILSSPRILTSDNQKAKITIGREQPILKSVTNLGTEGTDGKTVSDFIYKDVGIMFEVTPRINVDRDVTLDVNFTITSILAEVEFPGNIRAPAIGKREASTNVSIMDNHTLVIGGLMERSKRDERKSIPLLGQIPLIGWLFSDIRKVDVQTELLVFITPHVVESMEEGKNITDAERQSTGKEFKKIDKDSEREKEEEKK